MVESKRRLVRAWLAKSADDLAVARLLIRDEQRLLGAGVYHCQQAAEKAFKGWLTLNDVVFPRTHDLEVLVDLCATVNPSFSDYCNHAQLLTPLASEYRYPGDVETPDLEQARHLLDLAEELCSGTDKAIHTVMERG